VDVPRELAAAVLAPTAIVLVSLYFLIVFRFPGLR